LDGETLTFTDALGGTVTDTVSIDTLGVTDSVV